MSIESSSQPSPVETVEFKPYLVGKATQPELDARDKLFVDEDYSQGANDQIEAPSGQPVGTETITIPLLEPDNTEPVQRQHEDKLMEAHEIPQLEPLEPDHEPRHRLQD